MPLPNHQAPHHIVRQVTRKRFHADQLQRLLLGSDQQKKTKAVVSQCRKDKYWTGIHQGNYYRIKIPNTTNNQHNNNNTQHQNQLLLPKLHTPTSAPLPLKNVSRQHHHHHLATGGSSTSGGDPQQQQQLQQQQCSSSSWSSSWWETLQDWTNKNATILILNFGSICTLIGFTRSDVLELRILSVTGSICGMFFHGWTRPLRWTPIAWSALFALVNSAKIYEVVQERAGSVNLSSEQEQRYSDFFMPHGITPKQFEAIDGRAKIMHVQKNQVIVRQGEVLQHVYLIVQGHTRASVLGRFLTAASFRPVVESTSSASLSSNKQHPTTPLPPRRLAAPNSPGAAAGAWIGEMALLEHVWNEEVKYSPQRRRSHATRSDNDLDRAAGADEQHKPVTLLSRPGSINVNHSAGTVKGRLTTMATTDNDTKDLAPPTAVVKATSAAAVQENSNARALYTIVAQEDCTVLVWSHDEMKTLLARSPDMKAALTRAMTAAIVGKVVTFTASRSSGRQPQQPPPPWLLSSWISSEPSSSLISSQQQEHVESLATTIQGEVVAKDKMARKVDANRMEQVEEEDDHDTGAVVPNSQENLPRYPVRKFK